MDNQFRIKLWGVRGSIPSPLDPVSYRNNLFYALDEARRILQKNPAATTRSILRKLPDHITGITGGETTCVEISAEDQSIIIDLGTGSRRLGIDLLSRSKSKEIHILLTHTHWDHIQGLPFFVPAYIPGNTVHFYSGLEDLEDRLNAQQDLRFFPVHFKDTASIKKFYHLKVNKKFIIGPFTINTTALKHPGGSLAYSIEYNNKKIIFSTDTEFYGPDLDKVIKSKHSFYENADILLLDAQYTLEEAAAKVGWGHTSMPVAAQCATSWNVKHLVLIHHEPSHDELTIRRQFHQLLESKKDIKISLGIQDDVYEI